MPKHRLIPALILAAGLMAVSAPVFAADAECAAVQVQIKAAPATDSEPTLEQVRIYRVLQGGGLVRDAGLANHLWQVAGSLAQRGWTPPRITIRCVVRECEKLD